MHKQYTVAFRKYIFDNDIEYLDTNSEHSEWRFQKNMMKALSIAHFYKKYPHKDFMEKDVVSVLARMTAKSMYVAELKTLKPTTDTSSNQIIAAAMLTPFYIPLNIDGKIQVINFFEAGGMRCILNGFNIQKLMHATRMLDQLFMESRGYYFAATFADSDVSQHNLEKFMKDIDVFPELKEYRLFELDKKDERKRGVRWFRPDINVILNLADTMSNLRENPLITRRAPSNGDLEHRLHKDIEQIELSFEHGLYNILEAAQAISSQRPNSVEDLEKVLGTKVGDRFLEV